MKCAFYFIAFLATTSYAAVPFYDRRDVKLPSGAYWDSDGLLVFRNDDHKDVATSAANEITTDKGKTAVLPRTGFANLSSPALGSSADLEGKYAVEIRVGPSIQHVGTLRKHRIYQKIFDCLVNVGSPVVDNPNSNTENEMCKWPGYENGCMKECTIPNIVYNADFKNDKYATNAWLTVWVEWSEVREKAHPGLREVAYSMVANIYKLMTDDLANCYHIDFPGSRKTKMCNVGKQVKVAFPTNGDDIQARLDVSVQFNGDTKEGSWNPDDLHNPITNYFTTEAQGKIAEVMGWPQTDIKLFTSSQPEDCFETKGWWFAHPWVESKGCNSLTSST